MKCFEGFEKGVNLGGWLSQCSHEKAHYDSFINSSDLEKIHSWGADHVRLPIDYELIENAAGQPVEAGYSYIDSTLEQCRKLGMGVVIDVHKTAGFSFDKGEQETGFFESEKLQNRFIAMWERLAERYGKAEGRIAFELLNEVTEPEYSDTWNSIIYRAMDKIRPLAPTVPVITGGYWQNSPDALRDIAKPYDENVVLSFHCYDPLEFTHQGAPWVDGMDVNFRMKFDHEKVNTHYYAGRFSAAIEAADKYDVPLYCGEYGVIDRADPGDALSWFREINRIFKDFGISRCAWNYKGKDFGLSDKWIEPVIDELIKYL